MSKISEHFALFPDSTKEVWMATRLDREIAVAKFLTRVPGRSTSGQIELTRVDSRARLGGMAQCECKVFFPDEPPQRPPFSDCPRRAKTTRIVPGTSKILKSCSNCAKVWDGQDHESEGR